VVLTRLFCADVFSISKTKIAIVTIFLIQVFVSRAARRRNNKKIWKLAATLRRRERLITAIHSLLDFNTRLNNYFVHISSLPQHFNTPPVGFTLLLIRNVPSPVAPVILICTLFTYISISPFGVAPYPASIADRPGWAQRYS